MYFIQGCCPWKQIVTFQTQHVLTSLDELSNDYDGKRNQSFDDADVAFW